MIDKLKKILKYKNGFFLEAGAFDGINFSNTYYLEKELNWKGILIEPTLERYLSCIKNRKKSIAINCLLTSFEDYKKKKYAFGDFILSKTGGGGPMASINNIKLNNSVILKLKNLYSKIRGRYPFVPVRQVPLSYITDLLNIQKIDFFSLDVEGQEYNVLKGIDFKKLYIKYVYIEVRSHSKKKIFDLLNKNNFKCIGKTIYRKKKNSNWTDPGEYKNYLFQNK